jgi:hypothetical protein
MRLLGLWHHMEVKMKNVTSNVGTSTTQGLVKTMTCRLREGECYSRVFRLKGGTTFALTTEGWEDIDAVTIKLSDHMGRSIVPEVDNDDSALYFVPPDNGICTLKITIESLAWGRNSAKLRTTVRELPDTPFTANHSSMSEAFSL